MSYEIGSGGPVEEGTGGWTHKQRIHTSGPDGYEIEYDGANTLLIDGVQIDVEVLRDFIVSPDPQRKLRFKRELGTITVMSERTEEPFISWR